jgi:hypothetical protein
MINGAHSIIYSTNPDADRAFLRDVLGLPHVDVGGGWLIFGLPPSEVAVHGTDEIEGDSTEPPHQFYLMCHDVEALIQTMDLRSVETAPVQDRGYGLVTEITLPGGGKLPVYQPAHVRPESAPGRRVRGARGARPGSRRASAVSSPTRPKKKAAKKAIRREISKPLRKSPKKVAKAAKPAPTKPKPAKRKKAAKRGRG